LSCVFLKNPRTKSFDHLPPKKEGETKKKEGCEISSWPEKFIEIHLNSHLNDLGSIRKSGSSESFARLTLLRHLAKEKTKEDSDELNDEEEKAWR